MKALLLSAGLGTRLQPFTNKLPKCLMPVKGKPLLEIWLDRLSEAGVNDFLINTHYLPEYVEKFIKNSKYCNQTTLVYEPKLLGTAGTLRANLDFFNTEDSFLIHADNYCLEDHNKFIASHKRRPDKSIITMMVFRTSDPSSCGIVEINSEGIVTGFHEKINNPPGNLANGAVYILSSDFLRMLSHKFNYAKNFSTDILPSLIGKIYTYETKKTFIDIGTITNYEMLNE